MIRALWIDDEADSEKMASRFELLHDMGILITACSDLRVAHQLITSGDLDFDVILIDLVMPPMDLYELSETCAGTETGLRLIETIRARGSTIPVIIISLRRHGGVVHVLEELSVTAYVEKPCAATDLATVIRRAVVVGS